MKNSVSLQRILPQPFGTAAALTVITATVLLTAVPSAQAQVDIPLTLIDKAGNAADTTGYGAVAYNYYVGTSEVTNGQYAAFLNSVAKSDPNGLYSSSMSSFLGGITRSGESGSYTYTATRANAPVNYVSFLDAARFCNWLTNGANADASTETGMYTLADGGIGMTRDTDAWAAGGYAITSENEWYKAAYYNLDTESYTPYATGDTIGTDQANYGNSTASPYITDAGTYPEEQNGTLDMMGNVLEWNEGIHGNARGLRGGAFYSDDNNALGSSYWAGGLPGHEGYYYGFRISQFAPVPEPSTYAALISAAMLGAVFLRRLRKHAAGRGALKQTLS